MQAKDSGTIAYSANPQGLADTSKQEVSLDGDSFESDQKYFEQIPGFLEKLDKASKSPRSEWISAKEAGWDV